MRSELWLRLRSAWWRIPSSRFRDPYAMTATLMQMSMRLTIAGSHHPNRRIDRSIDRARERASERRRDFFLLFLPSIVFIRERDRTSSRWTNVKRHVTRNARESLLFSFHLPLLLLLRDTFLPTRHSFASFVAIQQFSLSLSLFLLPPLPPPFAPLCILEQTLVTLVVEQSITRPANLGQLRSKL